MVDDARVEVKAVTKRDDLELRVPVDRVEDADYFVLTQCSNPRELVRLMGYISRPEFSRFGHRFNGKLRVGLDRLHIFEPVFLPPEQIRATQTESDSITR
jgi:hypothetical protein